MQNKGEIEYQKLNKDQRLIILVNTLQQWTVKYVTAWLLINLIFSYTFQIFWALRHQHLCYYWRHIYSCWYCRFFAVSLS